MSAASYTTDLTLSSNADTLTWVKNGTWGVGGNPQADGEQFIQGGASPACNDQMITKSGLSGLIFNAAPSFQTDYAFTIWMFVTVTGLLETDANGGLRLTCGSTTTNFKGWNLGGKSSYVYGGWVNLAVCPEVAADYSIGGGAAGNYLGAAVNLATGASRGYCFGVDALYWGRCQSRFAGGTSPDAACTFAGFAAVNDALANRWGLIQQVGGGYLWKGLMTIGYGSPSAACRFTDSNTQILIDRCPKVTAGFSKIEIRNAATEVNWTGISFLTLTGSGSIANTASKGRLEVVDDCDVNISGCSFTGMDTFIFKSATDVLASVFRNCGQITANDANFAGTKFEGYEGIADSSYLLWNGSIDPQSKLAGCIFNKGTAATHAIEIGASGPTTVHIPNTCTFSGYNASNNQSDSTVYVARANGTVDIYYDGTISYKSAGATVNIHASQPTLTIDANVDLTGAEIRIYDLDSTLPFLGTELAGTESCPTSTYDYTGSAGNTIWVQIMKNGYVEYGQQVTMPSASQTINVLLTYDVSAEVTVEQGDLPTIVDVDPNPSYAGQQATIIGTNFDVAPVSVDFGGVPAADVSVQNSTTLTCTIPAHADGYVGITVVNGDGSSDPYSFLYQPPFGGPAGPVLPRPSRFGALLQT